MKKRNPVKIAKKTHLTIILLLTLVWLACLVIAYFGSLSVDSRSIVQPIPQTHSDSSGEIRETKSSSINSLPEHLELPDCNDPQFLIQCPQGRYTLRYDTLYRQAAWVAYLLTRKEVENPSTKRTNAFRSDPYVVAQGWPTATDKDYTGSGFDRGHLLPSADRNDSPTENSSTFLLSNISPQYPAFNRGIWRRLEEQVRQWAKRYDSLYIVTGGELKPDLPRMRGGIGIPKHFFKAILVRSGENYEGIAFLIPNSPQSEQDYFQYGLSIDQLEDRIKIDLYPALPDPIEEKAEARTNRSFWR